MSRNCLRILLMIAALWIAWMPVQAGAQAHTAACQSCHSDAAFMDRFAASAHGNNACTSCHTGINNIARHSSGEKRSNPVRCSSCHKEVADLYKADVHAVSENMTCSDCHQKIHAIRKSAKSPKIASTEQCLNCHAPEDYALLGHGKAVLAGNADSAACTDCHSLHKIMPYGGASIEEKAAQKEAYTRKCKSCHADKDIATRNNLPTAVADTYDATYHGKVMEVGFPQRVAGCADCHTDHNTLKPSDPRSALYPDNLYKTCKSCHVTIHKRFAEFEPHPGAVKGRAYRSLHVAEIFMIILLAGVFAFFWLHTALWWRRAYLDKYRIHKSGFIENTFVPECRDEKQIQRFPVIQRVMHVLLILSFFTLVGTGFPLKYAETAWAKVLVNMWGGPEMSGTFHRIAASILCLLFFYTLWLSIRFLFPNWQGRKGRQTAASTGRVPRA
jgi:hypothetical protein